MIKTMNYLEQIDEAIHNWFGSLNFTELEIIFNVTLIGLSGEDAEDELNLLRDYFYELDREEQIEFLTAYYNK
jgi:hypothetical protein